jgi:D-alanyl-D-alanine carboxypeptidase/D-alanyl-D-alanine-endopeptidase (penicillin-binding protein 4)
VARAPRAGSLVVIALLLAAVAFALLGVRSARADVVEAHGRTADGPVTPVVSARRVPDLLAQPVASTRLDAALAPLLVFMPPSSCLRVSDGAATIADVRGTAAFMPASNLKLVTAYAALQLLGPDTTFSTDVMAGAAAKGGTVSGDLYLVGRGDPLLTTDPYLPTIKYGIPPHTRLESVADQIVAAGVKHITGSVKGDESRYDALRTAPSWQPGSVAAIDAGPLSALAVNDARSYPAAGPVVGKIKPAAEPAAYAASTLTDLLRLRGVVVDGSPAAGVAPATGTKIASVRSLPLKDIVDEMLTWSDNNTAELLVKEVGFEKARAGTTAAGLAAIRAELTRAGVDQQGMILNDGSGLDRSDRMSCATFTDVLEADGVNGVIAKGLPVAASSGTLSDRYKHSPAASKVKAKTGTLHDVNSLSGWVTTDHGRPLTFSIVAQTSDVEASRMLDQRLTEAMLSYPDAPDPATLEPKPVPPR